MADVGFSKVVSALPGTLAANTLYFVRVGTGFRPYVTNSTGTIVAYPLDPFSYSELIGTYPKLDVLATPDDNTNLDASTSRHGLLRKLDNNASHWLNGQGAWTAPTATDVGLGNVTNVAQLPLSYLDTDVALAANSDVKVASQKAAKAYIDGRCAWKKIGRITSSGTPSQVDFDNTTYGLGSYRMLRASGWATPTTNSVSWYFLYSSNNGSSFDATNHIWTGDYTIPGVTTGDGNAATFSAGYFCDSIQNTSNVGIVFDATWYNFNVSLPTWCLYEIRARRGGTHTVMGGCVFHAATTAWNFLRFTFDSGTIAACDILLEGA